MNHGPGPPARRGPLTPPLSPSGGEGGDRGFDEAQRRYFERPDEARFRWQTLNPVVAERERALLPLVDGGPGGLCLEVGCGEGANLYQLARDDAGGRGSWVGVDLFFAKVRHAAGRVPAVRAVCARGQQLPFPDGTFRHVFSRDVFHHVMEKAGLLAEMRRVCAPGGTITLVEPNGRNPIIWLFAALHRAERDLMAMRPEVLRGLIGPGAPDPRTEFFDPFPIYRVVLHYLYGLPRLARFAWCRRALSAIEALARRILPEDRWAYFRITLTKGPERPGINPGPTPGTIRV